MAVNNPRYKGVGKAAYHYGCIYKDTPHRATGRSSGNFGRRLVRGVGMVSTRAWVAEITIRGHRYRYRSQHYHDCETFLEKMRERQ